MTKRELKELIKLVEAKEPQENVGCTVDGNPLNGIALSDFPVKKAVPKKAIVQYLRWQTLFLDGSIDYSELDTCIYLLKKKQVIMI